MARTRFIDKSGNTVFEVAYSAYSFSDGMCLICTLGANARYGYVNKMGEIVIQPQYISAGYFGDGLGYVAKQVGGSRKYGYVDHSGKVAIDFRFDEATTFSEGLAAYRVQGKWGFVNTRGKVAIAPRTAFRETPRFSEGRAAYHDGKMWGYVNPKGRFVIKPAFPMARAFSDGRAAVTDSNNRWGYIDKRGKWAIEPRFNRAGNFHDGRTAAKEGNQYRIVDLKGNLIVDFASLDFEVSEVAAFSEGLAAFKVKDKWGFINLDGEVVIEPNFGKNVQPSFSEGLCSVELDGKPCFINQSGEVVIETDAFTLSDFSEGLAGINYLK